jgi:citrate lyase subunit beta / citryl-CoA lyase
MISRTLRSLLFVPADRPDRYARAFESGADAVIFDLEDAVLEKAEGRLALIVGAPPPDQRAGVKTLVRINPPASAVGRGDMTAALKLQADGLVVPKADPASVALAAAAGLPLIALVETAAGVLAAAETAEHPAVATLMFGAVDLGAELGMSDSPAGDELLLFRSTLVLAAAAAGKPAPIDSPCLAIREPGVLELEIGRAKRLGFAGKACIHPSQIATVAAGFAAGVEEISWARRVVEASERAAGGVTVLDGRMVDRPVVARARQILAENKGRS